ncbi:hypothetical protein LPJ75_003019 [Coemansia sp. RSA 2598]|nr:hypothetical protein LPJ75_003019 [Coemansia sp. RSA 2598]
MVTIDNGSTAFVSCTSMPSLRAGYGSVQSQSGRQQPISCRNNESIQDVLAEVAAQLSISASRPASLIDSEEGSEYVTGSDISSRSSFIDAIAVEPAAYRCSGRFAPRLSTIERGKDGRLLIKPNGDCAAKDSQTSSLADLSPKSRMLASIAKADCSGAVDSGNESAADASPSPKTPPAVASGSLQSGQTRQYMVEEFPPVPDINGCARDRCAAARGPKDPMLMHNIRPSDDLDAKRSDALLSASLDDLVAKTVSASGESRPRSSTSPPSISPEKSRSITANTSVDTAETAKADSTPVMPLEQKADGNSLSGQPGVGKPEGKIDADSAPFVSLSEILVTSKRPQSGSLSSLSQSPSPSPSPRSLSGSLSPAKVQQENNLVCGNNSNVAAPAAAAETVASATDTGDAQPSRGLRSRHQMSIRRSTGLGGIANDSNQSTNSNMLSIFSDISESDMLFFDGSRMQQQGPPHFADGGFSQQLSLLFDGRPHSMLDDCSLTSVYSDADKSRRYLSGTATVEKGAAEAVARAPSVFVSGDLRTNRDGNFDDDDDDELALSDIIAINQAVISPPPTQLDAQIALSAPTSSNCRDLAAVSPQHVDASGKDAMGDSGLASSIASRTRKLSTALGSIRNLHRKIRGTASQSRSTGSGNSRHRNSNSNSDNASSSGSADAAAAGSDGSGADGYQPKQQQQQQQATKKTFRFNELVAVYETWNREEYDRKGMPSTKLDAEIIEQIKYELNEFKVYEMQVHEDSRRYTHFIY